MGDNESNPWQDSTAIAKAILHDRKQRRLLGLKLLSVIIVLFALGVFLLEDWLDSSVLFFLFYWGAIFLFVSFLMLLAIYDALRCIQEVKSEFNKEAAQELREIAELIKKAEEEEKNQQAGNPDSSKDTRSDG